MPRASELLRPGLLSVLIFLVGCRDKEPVPAPANNGLFLHLEHTYQQAPLALNQSWLPTLRNSIEVNHCQYYLSNFALQRSDSTWLEFPGLVTYSDLEKKLNQVWTMAGTVPTGTYLGLRFGVGLDSLRNHSDPASWPSDHPLALLNSAHMHWNWNTGYIFFKMEGQYQRSGMPVNGAFSYHLGSDDCYRIVRMNFAPVHLHQNREDLRVRLDFRKFFDEPHAHWITDTSSFSHSSLGDRVADILANNLANSFVWQGRVE